MQKRFIVKPVKIVWRNSMIAGNPITRSFQKFGVYDRNWQNDNYCWCQTQVANLSLIGKHVSIAL